MDNINAPIPKLPQTVSSKVNQNASKQKKRKLLKRTIAVYKRNAKENGIGIESKDVNYVMNRRSMCLCNILYFQYICIYI